MRPPSPYGEGVWEGVLVRPGREDWEPALVVTHHGRTLPGLEVVRAGPGEWAVRLPIPIETVSEGVQTYLIRDRDGDEILESFALVAGAPLADDLRAEIDLLRAELDMLKRAFRRHCVETA